MCYCRCVVLAMAVVDIAIVFLDGISVVDAFYPQIFLLLLFLYKFARPFDNRPDHSKCKDFMPRDRLSYLIYFLSKG